MLRILEAKHSGLLFAFFFWGSFYTIELHLLTQVTPSWMKLFYFHSTFVFLQLRFRKTKEMESFYPTFYVELVLFNFRRVTPNWPTLLICGVNFESEKDNIQKDFFLLFCTYVVFFGEAFHPFLFNDNVRLLICFAWFLV